MILQNQNVGIFSIVLRQLIFSGSLKKESHMKLNKIDIKMIVEKLKIIPNMLIKIIKLANGIIFILALFVTIYSIRQIIIN